MDKIKTVKTERNPNRFFEEAYFVKSGRKIIGKIYKHKYNYQAEYFGVCSFVNSFEDATNIITSNYIGFTEAFR